MGRSGSVEARHDVGRLEHHACLRGHEKPRVVVDPVQDLDVGPVGEDPVGSVGLPALVGHRGFEPDERAPRSLLGLRGDEAPAGQDPPDRRGSRRASVTPLEVDRNRVGPGIVTLLRQALAELDDLVLEGLGDPVPAPPGTPRPRLEPRLALGLEPPDELMDPAPREPVVSRHRRLRPPLDQDRRDHQPCQRHPPPP